MNNDKLIEAEKKFIKGRIQRNREQIEHETKNKDYDFLFILFLMSYVENDSKLLALMEFHHITLEEAQKILDDM